MALFKGAKAATRLFRRTDDAAEAQKAADSGFNWTNGGQPTGAASDEAVPAATGTRSAVRAGAAGGLLNASFLGVPVIAIILVLVVVTQTNIGPGRPR